MVSLSIEIAKAILVFKIAKTKLVKKSDGRRGQTAPAPGTSLVVAYPSVSWNRCASKSASLMVSCLAEVWQASARISPSISGIAARTAAVLRRSLL